MGNRSRAIVLSTVTAAVLAGSGLGVSSAFGATAHSPKNAVEFRTEHVHGAKGPVLVEGRGLVVYTFTGDKRGKAATCTGQCAAIWPLLRGTAVAEHGFRITGKFGTIKGQITYNGLPLYLFTGERPGQNRANSAFKVVQAQAQAPAHTPAPAPVPTASSPSHW